MTISPVDVVELTDHAEDRLAGVSVGQHYVRSRLTEGVGEYYFEPDTGHYEAFWSGQSIAAHYRIRRDELTTAVVPSIFVVGNPDVRYHDGDRFVSVDVL